MAIRALLHFANEEAVLCEMDDMPDPTHTFIRVRNPMRKDGKSLGLVDDRTTSIAYPWTRITYVEFFNEESTREAVMGFFRETG